MNLNTIAQKYFTRMYIVKMVTEYVLYYQVSLGNIIFESIGNMDETVKKLKELNLTLQPNDIVISILEIIKKNTNKEDFDKKFDELLKTKAIMQALKDFIEKDKELLNPDRFMQFKSKSIENGTFFNTQMKMQYLSEYKSMHHYYDNIITEEYTLMIRDLLQE